MDSMNETTYSSSGRAQPGATGLRRLALALPPAFQRMFNLNDPRWGRNEDDADDRPAAAHEPRNQQDDDRPQQRPG